MDPNAKLLQISESQLENFKAAQCINESIADHVFEILKNGSNFGISRVKIVGSTGKRGEKAQKLGNQPDLDLIVFVSEQKPPFTTALEHFARVLSHRGVNDPRFKYAHLRVAGHSVRFSVKRKDDDISQNHTTTVHLHLGMNLVSPENEKLPRAQIENIQTERALRFISKLSIKERRSKYMSMSIAEGTISFVEGQSPFVHGVIRLAKLWNNNVEWANPEYRMYRRSTIIELVATWAGSKEELDAKNGGRSESTLKAFKIFLKTFLDFDRSMFVFFPFKDYSNILLFYERHTEKTTSNPRALILDPINPFLNYAVQFTTDMQVAFKSRAQHTLQILKDYEKSGSEPTSCTQLENCFALK